MAFSDFTIYNTAFYDSRGGAPFITIPHLVRACYTEGNIGGVRYLGAVRTETSEAAGDGGTYREDGILSAFLRLDINCDIGSEIGLIQRHQLTNPAVPAWSIDDGYVLKVVKSAAAGVAGWTIQLDEVDAAVVTTLYGPAAIVATTWVHVGFEVQTSGPAQDDLHVKQDLTLTPGLDWSEWATSLYNATNANHIDDGAATFYANFVAGANQWAGFDYVYYREL